MFWSILLIIAMNFLGYILFDAYIADIAADKGTALATTLAWSTATASIILVIAYYNVWKDQHNKKIISEVSIEALKKYDEILIFVYPLIHKISSNSNTEFAQEYLLKNYDELYEKTVKLSIDFDLKLTLLEFLTNEKYDANYFLLSTKIFDFEPTDNEYNNQLIKLELLLDRFKNISGDEENIKDYLKKFIKA